MPPRDLNTTCSDFGHYEPRLIDLLTFRKRDAWDYVADDRVRIFAEVLIFVGLLVIWGAL